ncbi:MAG: GTPase Era [Pseudomonadota bacterium]|nr:GTPase Era [Pseudomonadota bacterium]
MSEPQGAMLAGTKCGVVALIGAPNAGKSTLVNQLVGAKVAIVTHKVQTTRARLRGIAMRGETQLVIVDTPGIFAPRRRLDRAMVEAAWSGARDADIVVLLIDAQKGLDDEARAILERLGDLRQRRILVLNKIDKVPRETLLALTQAVLNEVEFDATFMLSALTGDGVEDLLSHLVAASPSGPWLFPEDQIADAPLRVSAAEITREKLYLRLHQELPYASTVETLQWKELKDGSVRIEQTVFVERESQKKIVLGKGGRAIKQISTEAREELAETLGRPVHLFLFVKVRENWGDDPERYREMGLDYSDS